MMSLSSPFTTLILFAIPCLWVLFFCGALVFVLTRFNDGSDAKGLAATGITFMLLSRLISFGVPYLINLSSMQTAVDPFAVVSLITSIATIVGASCIIVAVFKGRSPNASFAEAFPGQERDHDNTNPFLPPGH